MTILYIHETSNSFNSKKKLDGNGNDGTDFFAFMPLAQPPFRLRQWKNINVDKLFNTGTDCEGVNTSRRVIRKWLSTNLSIYK